MSNINTNTPVYSNPKEQEHSIKAEEKKQKKEVKKDQMKMHAADTKEKLKDKAPGKKTQYNQTTHSDMGSGQNRGLYSNESANVNAGSHFYNDQQTQVTGVDSTTPATTNPSGVTSTGRPVEGGGMLHSAKETVTHACSALGAKISETAEVAKEKMSHLIHPNEPTTTTTPTTNTTDVNNANVNNPNFNNNVNNAATTTTPVVNDQFSTRPPVQGNYANVAEHKQTY